MVFGIFLGLRDQVDQIRDLGGRAPAAQGLEFLTGEAGGQMTGHVEALPPAIQDLRAGPGIRFPQAAVAEVDGTAQQGEAYFKRVEEQIIKSRILNSGDRSQKKGCDHSILTSVS